MYQAIKLNYGLDTAKYSDLLNGVSESIEK